MSGQPRSNHFDGKRFFNPGAPQASGFFGVLRWKLTSRPERSPAFISDVTPSLPARKVEGSELRVTLINHSTVLLQGHGTNILTDPVWSERVSPLRSLGPVRRREPGVRWDDLPEIDTVLLTHNHYDHLDLAALRRLAQPGRSQFVVPCGVARLLRSQNIGPVEELDWGERTQTANAIIHCVPAVHFSGRGLFDRNRTLWCGYVIEAASGPIYFAGDTAYGNHFANIREQFGPPRLALLPIGAYEPRWFMSPVHMGPEEALQAHEILGARTSIAIHHGTFQLGDDAVDTPANRLKLRACDSFLVLKNGESMTIRR